MKNYYNVEIVASDFLDEEDIADLESAISHSIYGLTGEYPKVTTEYVDSEG